MVDPLLELGNRRFDVLGRDALGNRHVVFPQGPHYGQRPCVRARKTGDPRTLEMKERVGSLARRAPPGWRPQAAFW